MGTMSGSNLGKECAMLMWKKFLKDWDKSSIDWDDNDGEMINAIFKDIKNGSNITN